MYASQATHKQNPSQIQIKSNFQKRNHVQGRQDPPRQRPADPLIIAILQIDFQRDFSKKFMIFWIQYSIFQHFSQIYTFL